MANFSFDETAALAAGGTESGKKVLDTGVYDITINTASKTIASTGTEGIDWNISVEGAKYPNMVYGFWIQKANGDKIFNMDIVQGLIGIIGAKGLTEVSKEIDVKDGKKTVTAYKELDGVVCQVAVQKVLDVYNGEVREKNEIKAFFNTKGQTYAEQMKSAEPKQSIYYSTKLTDKETPAYKKHKADHVDEHSTEEDTGSLL